MKLPTVTVYPMLSVELGIAPKYVSILGNRVTVALPDGRRVKLAKPDLRSDFLDHPLQLLETAMGAV